MPMAATTARRNTSSHTGHSGAPIACGTTNAATVASSEAASMGTPARSSRNGVVRKHTCVGQQQIGADECLRAKPYQHRVQRCGRTDQQDASHRRNGAGEVGDQDGARLAARDDGDAGGKRQEQPGRQRDQRQRRHRRRAARPARAASRPAAGSLPPSPRTAGTPERWTSRGSGPRRHAEPAGHAAASTAAAASAATAR